ncbi:MAG: DUF1801 domain-containing protein [Cyclobacteriaceae bacterium]|nr:DUF1801 domain-containing protein [Cyclobacteriaceae bacterium HetDA_MAG_MS6]
MDDVLNYIQEAPPAERLIMRQVHQMMLANPGVTCEIRYRVPFYYRKSWICYFNPIKDGGVELAFTRANELGNASGILDFKGRKQVAGITLNTLLDITESVEEIIQEALLLDEEVAYASKRKGK